MKQTFFISGIGTGIGKTFVSALLAETLYADYWKPVQAGYEDGTDSETLLSLVSNKHTVIHPEAYRLKMPASPHIAARAENIRIDTGLICDQFRNLNQQRPLIVEGAGGLLVPLNDTEMVIDLVRKLDARLILVSRNYLGSINHSLLTAEICRYRELAVAGWVFNDRFMDYEEEIVQRTGIPLLCSVPLLQKITPETVSREANRIRDRVNSLLTSIPDHPGE